MTTNFIEVFENAIDLKACDLLIEVMKDAEKKGFMKTREERNPNQDNKNYVDDVSAYIPDVTAEFAMGHVVDNLSNKFIADFWSNAYTPYTKKYPIINDLGPHSTYSMKLQITRPGQGYHMWHNEAANRESSTRILAWTAYLNDDFEAGETEFLYQHFRYKPKKGDVLIFPAAFTHPHRGNPPINGTKYIVTGWVEF